jgi:hypothetical protein
MTRSVCRTAAATLDLLTDGLDPGDRIEVRGRAGVHMALHVERLHDGPAGPLFTVAHRHPGQEPVPESRRTLWESAAAVTRVGLRQVGVRSFRTARRNFFATSKVISWVFQAMCCGSGLPWDAAQLAH